MSLKGRRIAILLAPRGTEEREFVEPKRAVAAAGADVTVIGLEKGAGQTVNHDLDPGDVYAVDLTIGEARPDDFDGLVVPGGTVGSDKLRGHDGVVSFVRAFVDQGKPVGVICHGPWLLAEADVLKGRTLTSFPSIATDLRNAGGHWVDEEVVVDGALVTSRKPDDLPAFCEKILAAFSARGVA